VAPGVINKGYGKIINFCSITLNGRWSGYVPYVALRGAMLGFTKTLARELGPHGARVNAVCTAAVVSEAEERAFGDRFRQYRDWIFEKQCPNSVARRMTLPVWCCFWPARGSDFIPSQNVAIDGGGDTRPAVRRIEAGSLVAEIVPELGGGLARFDLIRGGERLPVLRPWPDAGTCDPNRLACYVLVPWSNRLSQRGVIAEGRFYPLLNTLAGES
jgi:Enoyl-(Acyl carrier protein) reductase